MLGKAMSRSAQGSWLLPAYERIAVTAARPTPTPATFLNDYQDPLLHPYRNLYRVTVIRPAPHCLLSASTIQGARLVTDRVVQVSGGFVWSAESRRVAVLPDVPEAGTGSNYAGEPASRIAGTGGWSGRCA